MVGVTNPVQTTRHERGAAAVQSASAQVYRQAIAGVPRTDK
jgi:ribosomal protein L4